MSNRLVGGGRVAGHSLRNEGRVYIDSLVGYGSGPGQGRCSCGQVSQTLPNTARRQQWHRDHKADIRSGGNGVVWAG